jgi:hypothetical protein
VPFVALLPLRPLIAGGAIVRPILGGYDHTQRARFDKKDRRCLVVTEKRTVCANKTEALEFDDRVVDRVDDQERGGRSEQGRWEV